MYNLKEEVEKFFEKYPPALEIYNKLTQVGEVYIMGGILRELKDNGRIEKLRDADFAIDIKNKIIWKELINEVPNKKNHFGGYKFLCSNFIIDIWDVKKTWAFENDIIKVVDNDYFSNLSKSVYLNMDAIVYDLKNDRWNDDIYNVAKESGVIDIVLKKNPFEELNVLRAMVLRQKYSMKYSKELAKIILEYAEKESFEENMLKMQEKRYGNSLLKKEQIQREIINARNVIY